MSLYNDIVRRQHLPREDSIRRLMSETGVDLSLYGPASNENLEVECEEGEEGEEGEGGEEEHDEAVEDPEVEVENPPQPPLEAVEPGPVHHEPPQGS